MIDKPEHERRAALPRGASPTSPEPAARPEAELLVQEKELALAVEHPRGTERRRLLPYVIALNDTEAYARLPERDRDVIVRWAEIRRRISGRGVDHDPLNLADPLLPAAALRTHVLAGERIAARGGGAAAAGDDDDGDLIEIVARIRGR